MATEPVLTATPTTQAALATPRRRRRRVQSGFRTKLVWTSTIVALVCLTLAAVTLATIEVLAFRHKATERAVTLAEIVAANSEAALSFDDDAAADQLLATLAKDASIREARILPRDFTAAPLARFNRDADAELLALDAGMLNHPKLTLDGVGVLVPVTQDDEVIGHVYLQLDLAQQRALLKRLLTVFASLLVVTVALAWLLSARLQRSITEPVVELLRVVEHVRETQDYSQRAAMVGEDELGDLARAFNAMLDEIRHHDAHRASAERELKLLNEALEQRVAARTGELEQRNDELVALLERLKETQGQLVESEKMAALGGLVAGVAHEINTPLGICVTVSSHLQTRVEDLQAALVTGLRRSSLDEFLDEAKTAMPMLANNLRRAADLVRSFKLVAVDQSSEQRRDFNAAEYLAEVLRSLSHELKRSRVEVNLDCDTSLVLTSYPGVFAQILTNLCMNAMLHAYEGSGGRITIQGRRDHDHLLLTVVDFGAGMDESVRLRVFEPFFTTRRGSGGSGLGLHITYNQVTQQLGGSIVCRSSPGQGSRFEIRAPLVSPAPRGS